MKADHEWRKTHPEGEKPAAPVEPAPAPGAEAAPAEAVKPAEGAEGAPAVAATPQQLADLMQKSPEFGAFMEAHPEVKGPVFQMARKLAEAEPILAIAPTLGDAQFLQEYAASQVALKTASLRTIDNPESVPEFLNLLDSQFQQVDQDGKPKLDAGGQPIYDPDRAAVLGGIVNRELQSYATQLGTELEQLKTKLGGYYPSEAARNADQQRLDNIEYLQVALDVINQFRDGTYFETGPPELPADATEEQKAWFKQQTDELARRKQELDNERKGASKEERTAARATFSSNVRSDLGLSAGNVIATALKAVEDSGAYIPEMYKQEKYRDSSGREYNTPRLATELFIQFENELMKPGSRSAMDIAQHELLPQNDQTRQIRKDYYARKAAEMIPGMVDKAVARIQDLVKVDQSKQQARLEERRRATNPEPATGSSSLAAGASDAQILQAAEDAAKKLPEFAAASPRDQQAMILTQRHKLLRK